MLYFALALFLMQGGLVTLDNTAYDPFTDTAELVLHGVGKNDKISLTVRCRYDPSQFSLLFRFQSGLQGWTPFAGDEETKWRGNGDAEIRFDNGPIEKFEFLSVLRGSMVAGSKFDEGGKVIVTGEDDSLVKRFRSHDRLRIRVEAIWIGGGDPDSITQAVVEDFDISHVSAGDFAFMTETKCILVR